MGVTFDPAKDIGTLEGKVILVTGGAHLDTHETMQHAVNT